MDKRRKRFCFKKIAQTLKNMIRLLAWSWIKFDQVLKPMHVAACTLHAFFIQNTTCITGKYLQQLYSASIGVNSPGENSEPEVHYSDNFITVLRTAHYAIILMCKCSLINTYLDISCRWFCTRSWYLFSDCSLRFSSCSSDCFRRVMSRSKYSILSLSLAISVSCNNL